MRNFARKRERGETSKRLQRKRENTKRILRKHLFIRMYVQRQDCKILRIQLINRSEQNKADGV